jgi:hypothetical protein
MTRYRHVALIVICLVLSGCHRAALRSATVPAPPVASAQSESPASTPSASGPPLLPPGPLGDLDQLFLNSYTARRAAVIQTAPPFVVVSGSKLILHHNGKDDPVVVIPDIYHALKDIAHLPFTVYLQLSPIAGGATHLNDLEPSKLSEILVRIDAVRKVLSGSGYSADELVRQGQILDASQAIVSDTLKKKSIDRTVLASFAKTMGPLMLMNASDAGCFQIQATHAQLMKWKAIMSTEEWDGLMVVNRARHQARYRNAATQYFQWLLADKGPSWGYPGESMRVIYAESLAPTEKASDELATVLIDADASAAFFGDSWRLSEDILSAGAERCIRNLPDSDRLHQ